MDVQQLVSDFLSSEHGQQALASLNDQGIDGDSAQQYLGVAAEATHAHAEEQTSGLMGDHPGKSFFAAFAAGLVHGDGFLKSLVDGGEGVISGKVAEALAARAGVDPSTASTIAAAATPYLVSFLREKLA